MSGADTTPSGITVVGTGRASGVPDVFVVVLSASAGAASPAAALQRAGDALVAMRQAALDQGVPPGDLTTQGMSIRQDYDQQGQPSGYVADLTLIVRVDDEARPGDLVAACVQAGGEAARLQSTSFEHSDPTDLVARAREAAFADAVARATQLATLAGRTLGPVEQIVEGVADGGGGPYPMRAEMKMFAAGPPVDAGQLETSASVAVTWAWGTDTPR